MTSRVALVLLAVVLAFPRDAAAYIDPAAGGLALQLLLGGVAGVAVVGRLYYRKLLTLLGLRRRDQADATPSSTKS